MEFPGSDNLEPSTETGASSVSIRQILIDLVETLALAAVLFFAINAVSARVRVDGFSMLPTLQNGEYVLVNRLAYRTSVPERGDIIVFVSPVDDQDLIKRVIGLPGDHLRVTDGQVYLNGQALDEPYIAAAPLYDNEWTVSEGQLFVLGDNRNDSLDSHNWGLLPIENVIGKAVLIYWPPNDWNLIEHTQSLIPGSATGFFL